MMEVYDVADWKWHTTNSKDGEERSCLMEIVGVSSLRLEVRCSVDVVVNLISKDGETLFISQGRSVSLHTKIVGFSGVEICATAPFAYRVVGLDQNAEKVDPRSMAVVADESVKTPMQQLVAQELRKYVARYEAENILASDLSVEELLDDIDNGDLEFDEEPDMFGLGYEERMADFKARVAEAEADDGDEDPEPEGPHAPVSGAPSADGKVKPGETGSSKTVAST